MMHGVLASEVIAIRVLLALVFIAAAVGKMTHWTEFAGVVANYRLLPPIAVRPWACALPPLEVLVGLGLLLPWDWTRSVGTRPVWAWAAVAAAFLLAVFGVAMAVNLLRGRRHIDCGCFQSALSQRLRWSLVWRNGILALLSSIAVGKASAPPDTWVALNGLLGGIAAFAVLQSLNTLWAVPPVAARGGAALHAHPEEGA